MVFAAVGGGGGAVGGAVGGDCCDLDDGHVVLLPLG